MKWDENLNRCKQCYTLGLNTKLTLNITAIIYICTRCINVLVVYIGIEEERGVYLNRWGGSSPYNKRSLLDWRLEMSSS